MALHPVVIHHRIGSDALVTDHLIFVINPELAKGVSLVDHIFKMCCTFLAEKGPCNTLLMLLDNCVAHYKSKKHFYCLLGSNVRVQKVFYGARHGKSECDALGGTVKNLVARAVASRGVSITDARSFYEVCLQLQERFSRKREFFLIEEIEEFVFPALDTVKGTRALHHVRANLNKLEVRANCCFCEPCLSGNPRCVNLEQVGPWREVSLIKVNKVKTLPSVTDVPSLLASPVSNETERFLFFEDLYKLLNTATSFEQLVRISSNMKQYVDGFTLDFQARTLLSQPNVVVDRVAKDLLPDDIPTAHLPVATIGDGNCLPRAVSFLAFGNERYHVEIRCRLAMSMALHKDILLDCNKWSSEVFKGLDNDVNIIDQCLETSDFKLMPNPEKVFEEETMATVRLNVYCCLWQVFTVSLIAKCSVRSVYPPKGFEPYRLHCNRLYYCPLPGSHDDIICIMWSSTKRPGEMEDKYWTGNHFVPLLRISPEEPDVLNTGFIEGPPKGILDISSISTFNLSIEGTPKLESFYLVSWNGSVYVAQVIDMNFDDGTVKLSYMKEKKGLFFMGSVDTSWEPVTCIIREVFLEFNEEASTQRIQFFSAA